MRFRTFVPVIFAASSVLIGATPGKALNTVCSAYWSNAAVSGTATSTLNAGQPPCPPSAITTTVTVGSGANAGVVNSSDAITGTGTNSIPRTQPSSIDLGIPPTTTENLTLTFSQAVPNPTLFFSYLDPGTSFTFTQAFTLVQANNASASGQTVTAFNSAGNTINDGFIVRMQGTYSTINFAYANTTGAVQSVAFTAGGTYVPGPLPLMGASVAFGFSRRLRRRLQGQG
ncbi:MAG: hypothetical protein VKJ05_03565 [Synechococcaceae cyanobacterium]|nr:hypothetical protein [Synechococcaceae cyanobacterium]